MYSTAAQGTGERITEAALRILEAEGPAAVSMRRVAQEAEVTAMAIYHYFQNREALLNTVTEREFAKLADYIQAVSQAGNVEPRLLNTALAYVDYALDRPRIFEYVFSALRPGARRFPSDFRAGKSPSMNLVAAAVAEAMKQKLLKRDDIWEVTLAIHAHVHGYITLYLGGRIELNKDEFRALVRRSLRRLLHGLKA